ncbi:DNA replication/repair protein RecF [Candidatus Syntrophocurvum alkaliphilum]|nr:DNA replication and repair protein RecF [Candidatus Syntrophocurvum alkaliphilum]
MEYNAESNLNIFMGDNGQGKTNILEAIFVSSTGKSFRTPTDTNLINYEESWYSIKTKYVNNERKINSFIKLDQSKNKILQINNKKTSINNPESLKLVLFIPDDLDLVKGSPLKRRKFIDFTLKQISQDYSFNFDNYGKLLRKRNLLLKNDQTNTKSFNIINDLFVETAVKLILSRINFTSLLDQIIKPLYQEITNGKNTIKIRYALSFNIEDEKINQNILEKSFIENQRSIKDKEIKRKKSMIGPHLDDIHLYQDNKLARHFASQGQQRNIAVCLKLAEVYAFKKIKDYYPVFLLDEVLAELDQEKRLLLLNHLSKAEFQSFLTSVNSNNLRNVEAKLSVIKDGQLIGKE